MLFINIFMLAIAIGLLVPIAVLLIECTASLLPSRFEARDTVGTKPKVAVLIPAHNEADGIGETIETVLPQLTDRDRLIVIADNCNDETAVIARKYGATVLERQDLDRRGKGYALDYGLRFIEADPPEVVVLIDADCIVRQGTIAEISQMANAIARPVQATYLMEQPAKPSPKDSVSALAFTVKNLVRPSGLARLRLPCLLTGTGMAFPWSVIRQVSLASGNIVEDMQLGLDLAMTGYAPVFCSQARVTGKLPQQQQAAKTQRTRWEHGHLQTLLTQVPPLLKAAISQKRLDLLAIALDLCVPPLSLLVMLWTVALIIVLIAAVLGASWIPTVILAVEGFLILISIVAAWAKFGRTDIPILALLSVPFYILWKIPLYLTFLVRPQTKWIRTERDSISSN